jgi:hypothetical protein
VPISLSYTTPPPRGVLTRTTHVPHAGDVETGSKSKFWTGEVESGYKGPAYPGR